jgi:hypothetical protein
LVLRTLCPDEEFGRGCDYAEIHSRDRASLYELKECAFDRKKAKEAVRQLMDSVSDLLTNHVVDANCSFKKYVIRDKRKPSCWTDGGATACVQLNGVNYLELSAEQGQRIVRKYRARQKTY